MRKLVPTVPSPLVYEGVFYAVRDGGAAVSIDAEQGTVWKEGRIDSAADIILVAGSFTIERLGNSASARHR
jgi:hypothetical protein